MNVALIPVRGGSKSIPLKNIREIAGKPLVYWTAKAANDCVEIDRVYVATDCDKIKATVENFGLSKAVVVGRSAASASDTASTECVMLEFAEKYEFDNIVLIQATSPLLTADDLCGGFMEFYKQDTDSVLSVVRQKRFRWSEDEKGLVEPMNYDVFHRPRRQEFKGFLVENGAFYITSRNRLLESQNRISGNIRAYEMSESSYLEIDEPDDWKIIESIMQRQNEVQQNAFPEIKMFLMDCDGCLTDGGMYYGESGEELKKFNTRDGVGISLLKDLGIITGMVTGENVELNRRRCQKMKLDIYEAGVQDKATMIRKLSEKHGIPLNNIAYVGDDINDLEAMHIVGFACAPASAAEEIKNIAHYVTKCRGGEGVIREIADMLYQM